MGRRLSGGRLRIALDMPLIPDHFPKICEIGGLNFGIRRLLVCDPTVYDSRRIFTFLVILEIS